MLFLFSRKPHILIRILANKGEELCVLSSLTDKEKNMAEEIF